MATVPDLIAPGATVEETLHRLGYTAFRPQQQRAIEFLLADHNILAILPTGSGKSLIYQIAALHRSGITLVISPLIALMQDQVDKLQAQGIAATFINSTLSEAEEETRLAGMVDGTYKIVYVTPERLRQARFQGRLDGSTIGLLAVDEAHSIAEWGYDFRPDYLHIGNFRRAVGSPVTAALTATATIRVQEEIVQQLALGAARLLRTSADRPNIFLAAHRIRPEEQAEETKRALLLEIFAERVESNAIVYVGTRKDAEEIAALLREELGMPAGHYHAGVSDNQRAEIQRAFLEGELPVVVATNAFGMGIDRPDVRLVLHYQIPGSIEAYYQEAGRAGRDGEPAEAILLYHHSDRHLHEHFVRRGDLRYHDLRSLHEQLAELPAAETEAGEGDENGHRPERKFDLAEVSRNARFAGGAIKVRVALERLEEAGVVERGIYHGNKESIRLLPWDEDAVQAVAERLAAYREQQLAQLEEMVEYAENRLACRRRTLLAHFDESVEEDPRPDCCDICREKLEVAEFVAEIEEEQAAVEAEPEAPPPPLTETILDCVSAFEGLRTLVQLVDLLHGDERRYNRFRDSQYHGRLEAYEVAEIRDKVEQLIADGMLVVDDLETISTSDCTRP